MTLPFLIVGAGGHGRVVAEMIGALGRELRGFVDCDRATHGTTIHGIEVLGDDDYLNPGLARQFSLANGIGGITSLASRVAAFAHLSGEGYTFEPLVHPRAVVMGSASLGAGAQIMAGAVVQAGAHIGRDVIVNTGSIVEHDCRIGDHTHIAPGAILCGNVNVGERTFVGAGSTVIQNVRIGDGAFIGAGSVVVADVPAGARVAGIPAKAMS